MELDQLNKRIQWIEDERRKERDLIALFDNRLTVIEGEIGGLKEGLRDITGEVTRLAAVITRMDQFDQNLAQVRVENRQVIEELDKEINKRVDESEKNSRVAVTSIEASVIEVSKELENIKKLERNLQLRVDEELRLRRMIEETQQRVETLKRDEEEYTRTYRLLEDGRRQDSKRIIDTQGELTAVRKRLDDQRGHTELLRTNIRNIDTRLNELVAVESERRDATTSFLEKQAVGQVERDRTWKEWQSRFLTIEEQAQEIESKLITLDATQRDTKRAQSVLDELTARVERRMNEITEIQRLAEDRFRQEWATFKADDQKRWTNYSLTQEEVRGDSSREMERISNHTTQLEDALQELQDLVEQTNDDFGKRIQSVVVLMSEWAASYESLISRR